MELIKPTKSKLIICLGLSVIAIISVYFYALKNALVCAAIGCPTVGDVARKTALNSIIPIFLIFYLLSCVIVFIGNKVRHKNNKRKIKVRGLSKKEVMKEMRNSRVKPESKDLKNL